MVLLAIGVVTLLFLLVSHRLDRDYRRAGAVALVGHVLVAVVVIPRVPYSWDIAKFHEAALVVLAGGAPEYKHTVASFAAFQSIVYLLSDRTPMSLSVVNGLLAVLVPIPLRYLMQRLYPELRTTQLATLAVLFLPLPFFILTVPMRDALSVLVFATVLALFVATVTEESLWPAIAGLPLLGMLYLLRTELALVVLVGAGAAAAVLAVDSITGRPLPLSSMLVVTVPVGLLGFVLFADRFPLTRLNYIVSARAHGSAGYLTSFQYHSWADVFLSAPVRGLYFQFAPFPLQVQQTFHLLGALSLPVLIVLALASAVSLSEFEGDRIVLVFLVTTYLGGVLGYGLIDSNFGTTIRHRVPFVLLLVVFSSPVLDRWWSRLREADSWTS
ncbi:hypothetical protein [Haloarcula laminariae]|uniref:hypothetical protein n=1 Tax=Haloarcula laminariae TaxID=2961577 RepID=UPI0021C594A1|nr:hypothetical protein [Halomicroarcula laminariae]